MVLDDKGDAGVVLLDTSKETGPVVWADWRSAGLVHLGAGESELFSSFLPGSKTAYLNLATSRQ